MNYYLVPIVGSGLGADDWIPKYFPAMAFEPGTGWMACDHMDTALIAATTSPEQHAALIEHADVWSPTGALDEAIDFESTAAALKAHHIAHHWLEKGQSNRSVLRHIVAMSQLLQRWHPHAAAQVRPSTRDALHKTVGELARPHDAVASLKAAAQSMGAKINVHDGHTLADVLHRAGQHFTQNTVFSFGDL